jgi:hypothetical protein
MAFDSKTTFTAAIKGALAVGAVVFSASAGSAAVVTTFSLTNSSPVNVPTANYIESSNGITLTVNNAQGTDLPTAGGITGNTSGICAFIQNSTGDGNRRCGYIEGVAGTSTSSVLNSVDFSFNKNIFLRNFNVSGLNDVSSATLNFGSQSFTVTSAGIQNFTGDFLVNANTPIQLTTNSVSFNSGSSGAVRISNLNVEEVPGPLPLLGAASAFVYSRKLRQKISA